MRFFDRLIITVKKMQLAIRWKGLSKQEAMEVIVDKKDLVTPVAVKEFCDEAGAKLYIRYWAYDEFQRYKYFLEKV